MAYLQTHRALGEVVTGLLYVDSLATDCTAHSTQRSTRSTPWGASGCVRGASGIGQDQRQPAIKTC